MKRRPWIPKTKAMIVLECLKDQPVYSPECHCGKTVQKVIGKTRYECDLLNVHNRLRETEKAENQAQINGI